MDPIIVVPVALAVAWAATRKKKKPAKKTEPLPSVTEEPIKELPPPPIETDPVDPTDPGGQEPWRPGGPGQVGPKPFPGPGEGPKSPDEENPSPVEIYPGTTPEEIEAHPNAGYAVFVSSDCETVYEGERWYAEVFLPRARELVLEHTAAFHHPVAVIYELLVVMPTDEGVFGSFPVRHSEHVPFTGAEKCIAAWGEFVYGDFTPAGTYSGWISERSDPYDEYWDYMKWFSAEYPELSKLLGDINIALWDEPDLAEVFSREWPADEPPGELDFDV